MAMIRINCYGEKTEAERFDFRETRPPTDTKFVSGATYNRFGGKDPCAIHRIRVGAEGLVEERWAYGDWSGAESLAYEKTVDETLEVNS